MPIEYIKVEIRPTTFHDDYRELAVTVQVDGDQHHFIKIVPQDDFHTYFDMYMEAAKKAILDLVGRPSGEYVPDVVGTIDDEQQDPEGVDDVT